MILQLRRGSVREHNARPPAGKRLRRAHEPPYGKNQNARRNRGVPAMKCPVDNETLVMTERSGVEIDYCPRCRGVWLDRGELDKLIDRGSASAAAPAAEPAAPRQDSRESTSQPGPQPPPKTKENIPRRLQPS